jgi:hypothetical protein
MHTALSHALEVTGLQTKRHRHEPVEGVQYDALDTCKIEQLQITIDRFSKCGIHEQADSAYGRATSGTKPEKFISFQAKMTNHSATVNFLEYIERRMLWHPAARRHETEIWLSRPL